MIYPSKLPDGIERKIESYEDIIKTISATDLKIQNR